MAEHIAISTCDCARCLDDGVARASQSVALVAGGRWKIFRAADGTLSYGVPSSKPGRFYRTSADGCTCPDQNYRPWLLCKHIIAVRLYEEAVEQGVLA